MVGMDWIELAQYTDGRRDVVNEVMKLLVAQSAWGEGWVTGNCKLLKEVSAQWRALCVNFELSVGDNI